MKKLQILRVDNDSVQKVDLQIGDNIIGRSILNGRDDDQVIKQAVIINVKSDDEMTITPYQVTPCYMKSVESSRWQLLKLGVTVPIKPGDVCSLLPEKCWFKIISVSNDIRNNEGYTLKRKADDDIDSDIHDKKLCSESGEGDNLRSSCSILNNAINNNNYTEIVVKGALISKSNSSGKNEDKLQDHFNGYLIAVEEDSNKLEDANKMNVSENNMQENSGLPPVNENKSNVRLQSRHRLNPPLKKEHCKSEQKRSLNFLRKMEDSSAEESVEDSAEESVDESVHEPSSYVESSNDDDDDDDDDDDEKTFGGSEKENEWNSDTDYEY